jgi:hypothetical protein
MAITKYGAAEFEIEKTAQREPQRESPEYKTTEIHRRNPEQTQEMPAVKPRKRVQL